MRLQMRRVWTCFVNSCKRFPKMRDAYNFNMKFCELVESHPIIYDYNRPDYCNRNVQDQAWETIAKELKENTNDCKDRWKNIRNRYAKYRKTLLLPSGSGAKTVKEYYLAPHLHFLDYYLKSRRSKSNLADYDSSNEETSMSPHRLSSSAESASVPEPSPLSRNSSSKHKSTLNDVHQSALDYFNTKRTKMDCKVNEPIDKDLSFLHSMLSDMKAMNLSQKRKFKIGVMKLAEDILETPVTSPQNTTLPRESVAPMRNPQENENVASFFQLSPYSPVSPFIPNASFNENATLL